MTQPTRNMHNSNIETLRDEAKRQLQLLKNLLTKAEQKGFVAKAAPNEKDRATFDDKKLPQVQEVLDGESNKLDHLEMVLAVVGTMKAGKSTSINAIVGAEVLPNRNRPMTTLPTLIRHTPGVLQPRLIFEKVKPLNDLSVTLKKQLKNTPKDTLAQLQSDRDMENLLEAIQQGQPFGTGHEGEKGIFDFLKKLNDLARLCSVVGADFPFSEYAAVDSMPVIEVEFSHLKDTQVSQGLLTLLDTPGPNEAGQTHLRDMLKDQLQKASAVLAVLDYTQLKSDADAEVRQNLQEIADTVRDRMYVLVNKFDQRDRNSDDEASVKTYVAQTLMSGAMAEDHVYPVSSQQGYLASRARNELQRYGKLPAAAAWVNDFGSLALGMTWDTETAGDTTSMKKASDGLWKKSGFALPLEQVVVQAYRNAALDALRSAASKLAKYTHDLHDFFKASAGALQKSTAELQKNIDGLQRDIDKLRDLENELRDSLLKALAKVRADIESEQNQITNEIKNGLDAYFKEGKQIEAINRQKKAEANKRPSQKKDRKTAGSAMWPFARRLGGLISDSESSDEAEEKDFDPQKTVIQFDKKSEARNFMERIEKSVRTALGNAEDGFQDCITEGVDEFSEEFEDRSKQSMDEIKSSIDKNLEGFGIDVRLPGKIKINLNTSMSGVFDDIIAGKTKTVTKSRRKNNAWGKVCRWFNTSDWGWEDYQTTEDYFEVDLRKIRKSSEQGADALFSSAKEVLQEQVYPRLKESLDEFFGEFGAKVENVRGDLLAGVKKHNLDQEKKAQLLEDSKEMVREASDLEKDCATVNESAETLRREAGVAVVQGKE